MFTISIIDIVQAVRYTQVHVSCTCVYVCHIHTAINRLSEQFLHVHESELFTISSEVPKPTACVASFFSSKLKKKPQVVLEQC